MMIFNYFSTDPIQSWHTVYPSRLLTQAIIPICPFQAIINIICQENILLLSVFDLSYHCISVCIFGVERGWLADKS